MMLQEHIFRVAMAQGARVLQERTNRWVNQAPPQARDASLSLQVCNRMQTADSKLQH